MYDRLLTNQNRKHICERYFDASFRMHSPLSNFYDPDTIATSMIWVNHGSSTLNKLLRPGDHRYVTGMSPSWPYHPPQVSMDSLMIKGAHHGPRKKPVTLRKMFKFLISTSILETIIVLQFIYWFFHFIPPLDNDILYNFIKKIPQTVPYNFYSSIWFSIRGTKADFDLQNGQPIVAPPESSFICSAHARQKTCPQEMIAARRRGASDRQTPQERETMRADL